jgi:hypothetical protein
LHCEKTPIQHLRCDEGVLAKHVLYEANRAAAVLGIAEAVLVDSTPGGWFARSYRAA